jgi:hypothetical protein
LLGSPRASTNFMNSPRRDVTRGLTTRPTRDTKPSRVLFRPSPLASLSRPRLSSSKVSRTSMAKLAYAMACSCVALGLGDCAVGRARKAGDVKSGNTLEVKLVMNPDRGRCKERTIARWRCGFSRLAFNSLRVDDKTCLNVSHNVMMICVIIVLTRR